jgi:hypothetical protein
MAPPTSAPPAVVQSAPPPVPAAPPAPEPDDQPRTFDIEHASSQLAFRLTMPRGCTSTSYACEGPADLTVCRKDVFGRIAATAVQTEHLDNVVLTLTGGVPLVNSTPLHDDQGVVEVADYDFDGRDDFAVQIGHDGPHGGPTYVVYLDSPARGRFVADDALSELTRTTLGMFEIDAGRKHLVTLAKSGCCWHEKTVYEIAGGRPVPVATLTEALQIWEDGGLEVTESRLVGGRWRSRTEVQPLDPDVGH